MSWATSTQRFIPRLSALRARVFARKYSSETTQTAVDESDFAQMREAVKTLSFANPQSNTQLSPQLREQLTAEFDKFLQDFVHDVDPSQRIAETITEKVSGVDAAAFSSMAKTQVSQDGNLQGKTKFSSVATTDPDQPYSEAEMYVRQLFHAQRVANLGANISDVYKPHEDLHKPRSIAETSLSTLLAAGAHLGHATSKVRANSLPYVYGIREGIHIIDLQQTLAALRRVSRVVEELSRKGGIVLFVGTREGQRRTVEKAAQRAHGFYVYDRWIPGTFTNYQILIDQKQKAARAEVDMADQPTGRQLSPSLHDTIIKPDLAIIMNPVENRALLAECIKMRIPTAGIVDTDSEPSLLTYPVPGNDDSLRFVDLVSGVLSRAAARGRALRLQEFKQAQAAKAKLREGEINLTGEPRRSELSEAEQELL